MDFLFAYFALILQRLMELFIARKNTRRLVRMGAVEYGASHYWLLITLHSAFLLSLLIEAGVQKARFSDTWFIYALIFVLAQFARFWVISSLQGRWTTRILVLRNQPKLRGGLFRWFSHPNYMVVAIEFFSFPKIFNLKVTAATFTLLNAFVLLQVRIPEENRAWKET